MSIVDAKSHVRATLVVPEGYPDGCEHPNKEGHWVPRDESYDYTGLFTPEATAIMVVVQIGGAETAGSTAVGASNNAVGSGVADVATTPSLCDA